MTPFETFLKDNKIKKIEIAQYLGIVPSNITKYCQGEPVPDCNLAKIKANKNGWDCSALTRPQPKKEKDKDRNDEATIEMLRYELETLRQVINNQSMIIARYESIISSMTGKND